MTLLSLGPASTGLALDSLDCGIALASTAKPSRGLIEGRRLAAPRVMDRPRLVGWSSLCHARPQCLTSLVVGAGTALPVPCRWRSCSGSRTSRCVHPGVDPCDLDRPAPVPSGTMRVEIGTPSVVSRADQGLPRPPHRACLVSESTARYAHRSHPEAGVRCVRQHAVRSAPGPAPCRRFALRLLVRHGSRCFGPTSAISRLRTSTRASWVPDFGHGLDARACRGTFWFTPERLASADRTVGFSLHARGVVFPSSCVRTRF